MITAIVFDCFGVLTSDGWLPFKSKHFGHDSGLHQEASSISKQSDAGLISYDDFIDGVADLAEVSSSSARHEIENNVANEQLFDYIRLLKSDYKIGFLSNVSNNLLHSLFTKEQVALFNVVSLSYKTGFVKPDERAYTSTANSLGVPIEECVLIDDSERNCTAAREVGMQAVWFQNTDQAIAELKGMLKG